MTRKERLIQLIDELSEVDTERVLRFAEEIKAAREREAEDHAPAKFWDNDDKTWNKISR